MLGKEAVMAFYWKFCEETGSICEERTSSVYAILCYNGEMFEIESQWIATKENGF